MSRKVWSQGLLLTVLVFSLPDGTRAANSPDVATEVHATTEATPAFVDGDSKWYSTSIIKAERKTRESKCSVKYGDETTTDLDPGPNLLMMCYQAQVEPVSEATIDSYYNAAEKDSRLPPSRQVGKRALWRKAVAAQFASTKCPRGMTLLVDEHGTQTHQCDDVSSREDCKGWAKPTVYVACKATMTAKEFCSNGDFSAADRTCTDWVCPEGTESISRVLGKSVPGCFKCPEGVLDLVETLAARNDTPSSFVLKLYWEHPGGVLCRVGPAKKVEAERPSSTSKKKAKHG